MFCSVGVDVHDPLVQHVRFCDHFNRHNCKCIYNFLFFNDSLFSRHFYSCFNVVLYKIAVSILTRCAVFWVFFIYKEKKNELLIPDCQKVTKNKMVLFCFFSFAFDFKLSWRFLDWKGHFFASCCFQIWCQFSAYSSKHVTHILNNFPYLAGRAIHSISQPRMSQSIHECHS